MPINAPWDDPTLIRTPRDRGAQTRSRRPDNPAADRPLLPQKLVPNAVPHPAKDGRNRIFDATKLKAMRGSRFQGPKGLVHQPSHIEGPHLEAVCLNGRRSQWTSDCHSQDAATGRIATA